MSGPSPAPRGARSRALAILAVAVSLVLLATFAPAPVAAVQDPARAVQTAIEGLTAAVDRVVAAEATSAEVFERQREARRLEASDQAEVNRAKVVLDDQRKRYGALGAASYVHHGVASKRDHQVMVAAMTARKTMLSDALVASRAAGEAYAVAIDTRERADREFAAAEAIRGVAETDRATEEAAADQAMAAVGATDLPAAAYLAYKRAADDANAATANCRLSGAVLAGLGRVKWRHGRPTGPTAQLAVVAPEAGHPLGPYDLQNSSGPVAAALCATGRPLDGFAALQSALYSLDRDSQQVTVILAAARRYARMPGVELGTVPADPFQVSDGMPQFDDGSPLLAPGDVNGMIDWALTRIGTPYSQCLGPDARPQDPICPPGTNRYGVGFFDCSGFLSAAYRKIGVSVPVTTYAMEADARFMSLRVADKLDPGVLQPGDVFLMDGHTGMYVGGGQILHARSGGLTLEPTPSWVAHATFAVLRPVDALGVPAPGPFGSGVPVPG